LGYDVNGAEFWKETSNWLRMAIGSKKMRWRLSSTPSDG
jgi:hypothetical protein